MKKVLIRGRGRRRIIKLKKLCYTIKRRLTEDRDYPICITGPEGEGKSVLGIQMIRIIDDNFSLKRNVLFAPTVKQADEFFKNENAGSAPQFDEFGEVGYKMDFANSLSKFLKKLFMKNRQANMAPIFCIPNFLDMDKYYRWRIKLLIFVYRRGRFVVFKPHKYNPFSGDNWQTTINQKIWNQITHNKPVTNDHSFLKVVRKWTIYRGEGCFSKLPSTLEALYKQLKGDYFVNSGELNKQLEIVNDSRKTVIIKKLIAGLIEWGISKSDLSKITGLSVSTLKKYYENCDVNDELYKVFDKVIYKLLNSKSKNKRFLTFVKKRQELKSVQLKNLESKI